MPNYRISRQLNIPVPAQRVQQQIQDIQSYPEYLPGCLGAGVLEEHSDGGVTAWLRLQAPVGSIHIVTRNDYSQNQVQMRMLKGPLNELKGRWILTPLSESSVQVDLEINLRSWLPLPSTLLEREADRLVQAMRQRALSNTESNDC